MQATGLDKTRILLETMIQEVNEESKKWAEVAAKAKDEIAELQNLIEELRANVVEKDTRLDHLQKKNNKLSTLLSKVKGDAMMNSRRPNNTLIFWTPIMQQALRILEWMLWKTFPKWTLAPLSLTWLLLLTLFFKLAPRTSMWKTTLLLIHFKTTPTLMPLLHKDKTFTFRLFLVFLSFSFFFFFYLIHCFGSFYCNPSAFYLVHSFRTGF